MIRQFIHRLLLRRHFWRHATFSEIAELYTSRMFRMMAINISGSLVSVYLYQLGYSLQFIALFWTLFYFMKVFFALPAAKYAAQFGPKHGMLLSNLLYIPAIASVTFVPEHGIKALAIMGVLQGISSTLYNVCYMIDFSKVKSVEHAGKEIAYMNIIEKFTKGASPFLGGLLAFVAGPEATMWAAALLFGAASLPLLQTVEPTMLRQKLQFKGFPWRLVMSSLFANFGVGFDVVASGVIWSLLITISILGISADSNAVYAQLGALLSVVTLAAFAASYAYGQLIDKNRGGELLRISVISNAIVHATRPFVSSTGVVVATNIANEAATTGYNMALTRGIFDTADRSGRRIVYFGFIEIVLNLGASLAAFALFILCGYFGEIKSMHLFFFIAAAVVLLVMAPKFRIYQK